MVGNCETKVKSQETDGEGWQSLEGGSRCVLRYFHLAGKGLRQMGKLLVTGGMGFFHLETDHHAW